MILFIKKKKLWEMQVESYLLQFFTQIRLNTLLITNMLFG